ncbi:MAG: AAA family ATPase, partial [Pseudomonadota bacterium]|nr:AAA family ATPase [Pseudomonadota bacterium]
MTSLPELEPLGLGRYSELFAVHGIGVDVLADLTDGDLEKLGLAIGDRRRILKAAQNLKVVEGRAASTPAPAREAERRQLTVMFVDLVGSTALSGRLDPEEMRDVLRAYQNTVSGEISRLEGFTAKLMGDGVLAYFGWPRTHEDEAERAVRAGLAVVAAVGRLPMAGGQPLVARVGIATGLVVVGDLVGEGAAQEQAVVGDTPNLAARLQAAAEPGMVVIAEATRRLLGDLFEMRDLGEQSLKGIQEKVPAFAVLGERALESRFAARQAGGPAPIVGRDQELGLLLERWRQATGSEGQAVLLTGEAGIGKSRISEALVEAVAGEPHFLLRYQCSPYHADSALYPVVQQLSHAARFSADDEVERRLEKLEALLAKAGDDGATAAPLFAALLGLDGILRYGALTLTPHQRRSRTLAALIDQLVGLAGRKPVLWLIEDAHWIDPTTLELIELALDRVQSTSVLLLITARPTFVAGFASHPVVTRLALNRLARAATQAIVARITHGKRLPDALLDEITAKTDGVPLFVEEMTKAVIESGVLRETADAYQLDRPLSALAVPATLHDSLMARLDRLHGVKEVAQTAAVIGRSFDHSTIVELAGLPERELTEALQRLLAAELVFRRGTPPDATYLFKHALVRDAAYESLLKVRRITLHARLLDVLENGGNAAPEVKAQHAEAAGLDARALDYWEQAGIQALARPAYKEAIASLENGVRLCGARSADLRWKRREQGLHLQLGQALIANQGYQAPATLRAFERAMALADEIGDVSLQLPAAYGKWVAPYIIGTRSAELAQRYAALAETQPETGPRLVGLRMLGLERFHEGRFKESLSLMTKAYDGYDPIAHRDLALRYGHDPRAASANYQAWNLWLLGFPDQAARKIDEGLRWAREVNHANTTGLVLCYGANIAHIWLRQPDRVESGAREALRLAEDNSMALWHAVAQIQLGWALSQQSTAPGLDEIEAGLRDVNQLGAGRIELLHLSLAADAYARADRHDEARASIGKAFTALAHVGDQACAAELHRIRAVLPRGGGAGERDAAEADLRGALKIARQQEAPSLEL